ncbi:L,D-transpeptidase, partial [Streptomyces beijiangensis]|nr:L,D-transpeptidase [Streptomyces beijiangensis]
MRHPLSRLGLSLALVVPALLGRVGPASLAPGRAPRCTAVTGPYQREVERGLRLTGGGGQSPADCRPSAV